MNKAAFLTSVLGFLTLPSLILVAQSGQVTHAPDYEFRLMIPSISIPTSPNAPFTATVGT
jgi:hypothetical protein